MREWKKTLPALADADAQLIVLTGDTGQVMRAAVEKQGLQGVPWASVDPALWTAWGIENPKRPEIPVPTTWIVDADGRIIWRTQTGNYGSRVNASKVVERLLQYAAGRPFDPGQTATAIKPAALQLSAVPLPKGVGLQVTVPEGYHTYGRKERNARPLWVEVEGEAVRAKIPKGPTITGSFQIHLRTDAAAGVLHYQLCSEGLCGPPEQAPWRVSPR